MSLQQSMHFKFILRNSQNNLKLPAILTLNEIKIELESQYYDVTSCCSTITDEYVLLLRS